MEITWKCSGSGAFLLVNRVVLVRVARRWAMPFQDAFIHKVMECCARELEASSQTRGEFISRNPLLGACELHRHDLTLVGGFIRSATITLVRSFLH